MPIFHDVYPRPPPRPDNAEEADRRHEPETTDNDRLPSHEQGRDRTMLEDGHDGRPISREELIERIKRGESPTWTIQHHFRQQSPTPYTSPGTRPRQRTPTPPSNLLPAAEIEEHSRTAWPSADAHQAGLAIERPRSALHSGDFRDEKEPSDDSGQGQGTQPLSTSPPAPWAAAFPPAFNATKFRGLEKYVGLQVPAPPHSRERAVSQASSATGFQFLPPTSPLVHSSLNPDLDFTPKLWSEQRQKSPGRDGRRHTFSPLSFQHYQQQAGRLSTPPRAPPGFRREANSPYQAHQPRRSVSSLSHLVQQPGLSPRSPHMQTRRPSISSEASPLHHAPMVGSYEESILRGRMSTTPSRPLNFVAQIGVLGKGNCKPSLRCPAHVTVPFPAVFYSYGTGSSRGTDDQPSPYVGLVDLENNLRRDDADVSPRLRGHRQRTYTPDAHGSDGHSNGYTGDHSPSDRLRAIRLRKLENHKRRSQSPKMLRAPPGGSYRIPPVGQLQIVIKNPHKTAVKLFLVPYDLSDMEPGTKTFLRQRSYSVGPIIDMPLAARNNLGTDRPEASLSCSDDPRDRPVLRYLVHLNVCCLGKKGSERHYLYKSIRVVFANRVPDGKENLRNEVQLPDPRYSAYKPTQETQLHSPHSSFAQEQASRRRSAALPVSRMSLDAMDGIVSTSVQPPNQPDNALAYLDFDTFTPIVSSVPARVKNPFLHGHMDEVPPVPALPFGNGRLDSVASRPNSRDAGESDSAEPSSRSISITSQSMGQPTSPVSPLSYLGNRRTREQFVRSESAGMELDEAGMGIAPMEFRRGQSPSLNGRATPESLLSRRLRNAS